VRGTARRIGCITYTNAATHEIESRVREVVGAEDEDGYEVSTIHSFCLRHIVRPYRYFVPELREGFTILVPEDELFREISRQVASAYNLPPRTLDSFSGIQRLPGGAIFSPDEIGQLAAEAFLRAVEAQGYRTLSDIVFFATEILNAAPFVARSLGSAFAWILVDEFQDTSEAQVLVLSHIADTRRTKFFLVGDPNQSIMGFAGARPDLMRAFASRIAAGVPALLAGNYRSSRPIIDLAEQLCPTSPSMQAVGPHRDHTSAPVYMHVKSPEEAILGHFLPAVDQESIPLGEVAILAPQWFTLYGLGKRLRHEGVPIFGPGARPYRRRLVFAAFAEEVCAYLESRHAANVAGAQRSLFHMLEELTGKSEWMVFSYDGRLLITRFLHEAARLRKFVPDAESWIRQAVEAFGAIMVPSGLLTVENMRTIRESAEQMIEGLRNDSDLVSPVAVEHLGLFAVPRDCVVLMTLHASKGREFDAVALLDLHDGKIPHWKARGEQIEEARRLLYVGITRARKLLMLFTDSRNPKNRPTPFLGSGALNLL
jgi:DNA helicase-2/ATP-dependent DNA helicase PcrA